MAQLGSALVWGTRGPEFKSRWPDHFSLFYGFRFSGVSTRFPLRYLIPPVALLAAVAWASSFDESSPQGPDIVNFDKMAHFLVFGLMGTLWFRWVPGPLRSNLRIAWAFLLTIIYGIVDEWIQFYDPLGRRIQWTLSQIGLGRQRRFLFTALGDSIDALWKRGLGM